MSLIYHCWEQKRKNINVFSSTVPVVFTSAACTVFNIQLYQGYFNLNKDLKERDKLSIRLGFSFYLAVVGGPVVFLSGLCTVIGRGKTNCITQPDHQ